MSPYRLHPIPVDRLNTVVSPSDQEESKHSSTGKSQSNRSQRRKLTLGYLPLPKALNDTAHVSILNVPAEHDGAVTEIKVRLGAPAPGDGLDWEVRIYNRDSKLNLSRALDSLAKSTTQHLAIYPFPPGIMCCSTTRSADVSPYRQGRNTS